MVMTTRVRVLAIGLGILCFSCGQPRLTKIAGNWYIDDVPAGTASPHLYWVTMGRRVVVDRQIRSYAHSACLMYETVRPGLASVIFAVESGKTPVAVASSDALRPWHLERLGLKRFNPPATDELGKTILLMEAIDVNELCLLAWRQPPFTEDWAKRATSIANVKIQQTSFDVHGSDSVGNTTLSEAVRTRHPDVVDELIRAGADVNAPNEAGITPLMTAVAFNVEDTIVLRRLLEAGADINAQDRGGGTALMAAANYNREEAASVLLEHGADPSIRDNLGRNAASMTNDSAAKLHRLLDDAAKRGR